jgi:uncharacterized protein YggE
MKLSSLASPFILLTLGIYTVSNIALLSPAMAQEQILKTLTVTGKGMVRVPTTLTDVSLGVEIQGKTAMEVQKNVAQKTSSVVDFLRSRQVQRLETTGIRLQPNYKYENNQRLLVGYVGTNIVSFRIKTEAVGNLLDEAVISGATRIDRVSFTATEMAISEAKKEALKSATLDAQQQADAVLAVLNFKSQDIISISINGANTPQPQLIESAATFRTAASAAADTTPVIGGEQTVQATVTLQIRY